MMNPYVKNLGKVRPTAEGDHNIAKEYDVLSIVTVDSSSYISRKFVPVGTSINNKEYWQLLAKGGVNDNNNDNDNSNIDNEQLEQIINDIKNQSIALTNHANNNDIHVTKEEKDKWNQNLAGETYIADEEDITLIEKDQDKVYQFKNRDTSNGMGYIILRKEKALAEQVTEENTIYEVRYDFDLENTILNIPTNCILDFKGGSFSNGTIKGNDTKLYGNPAYSIFNDCEVLGFNVGYFDVRWFGAISDYNSTTNTGTDNAVYFDRAIKTCGKHMGAYVKVIGEYMITSTIEVKYDLNLVGDYHVGRSFWTPSDSGYVDTDVVEEGCNSMIYVPENVIAFKVVGRGLETRKTANMSINNIRFLGGSTESSILIEFTATGAPPRVGKFAECRCSGFNKVLYFHDLGEFDYGTIYGNMTIEKVVAYGCNQFIVAKASGDLVPTLCNLIVKDSNIEQNNSNAIYLENLFGPNVIDNCLLENSPNVIYASIIGGSLEITNNYFEQQGGDYMLRVEGKNSNNCFLTCTGNYRVNQDAGKPYDIRSVTVVDFNTTSNKYSDVQFKGCIVEKNLWRKLNVSGIITHSRFTDIKYYKVYPYDDFAFPMSFGGNKLKGGMRGLINYTGTKSRASRVHCPVVAGDKILACYYFNGASQHLIYLCDDSGAIISEETPILYAGAEGVQFYTFTINSPTNYINVYIDCENPITLGNGFLFKNVPEDIRLSELGVMFPNNVNDDSNIEYKSVESLRGMTYVSEGTYDGMYYSDGVNIRNSDGSLFSKVKIISKYIPDTTFTQANTIYKIVGDLDLNGSNVVIKSGCILDFTLGGTISNGTLTLTKTLLYPLGLTPANHISATLKGYYKDGQIVYDVSLGKLKLMHNSNMINVDGTPLDS